MKPSVQRSLAAIAVITSVFTACSLFSAIAAERVAFVIGNDVYPAVPLENAVRDATAFRDMLTRDLGFATEDVVFMTNSSRLAIFEQFETFKKKTAGARIVLVFYAGHGMESLSGKENFILPVDANVMQAVESEAALRASGINIMTLTQELGDVSDAAKIFLVDACRERPQGRGIARTGGGLVAYADDQIPADTLMILAAAPKGLASDGEKHGPFTAALLDILPKGGQDLMNAFFAVSDRVQEVTQKQQIPWLKFDGSGAIFRANSFLIASVPGVAPLPMAPPAVVEQKGSKMEFTQADLALPHRWIDAQGRETEAVFGGIQGSGADTMVLLKTVNGTTGPYPLSKLSPESNEMARKLAAIDPGPQSQTAATPPMPGGSATLLVPVPAVSPSAPGGGFSSARGFTNNLGMTFIPVPNTDVLFCEHETRVKDYAAYAAANPEVDMSWKDVESSGHKQTSEQPVVNVSWEDAKAFCQWLSAKEGKKYRLPTDHEWSVAVGLGGQENAFASPKDKSTKIEGYPWGNAWPPPTGAGNFALIPGYSDSHPFTAPVKSYNVGKHGLYDLSGNAWEWCEDLYSSADAHRVLRGGSWGFVDARLNLQSSSRSGNPPTFRHVYNGFRCVVLPVR